jgi:Putative auto-transporter adhesin, head GIN domain
MKRLIITCLVSISLFSSCRMLSGRNVRGDGNVVSQTRSFRDFNAVDVSGGIKVFITADSNYSVRVETDQNLQEFVEVYSEGKTLRIKNASNTDIDATGDIKVYVSAPMFERFNASGACSINTTSRIASSGTIDVELSGASSINGDLKAPKITVHLTGACNAELIGETKDLSIDGTGASTIKAFGLLAENVDVDLTGAGDAEVYASVKLDADATGAASVHYKGTAAVTSDVSGAGAVKKVD